MNVKRDRQAGNLILIVTLALVIVGLVGILGWQLYSRNRQGTGPSTTTTSVQHASSQPTDTYAGWQTYCSTGGGICFKYPADWTLSKATNPSDGSDLATVMNAGQNVEVTYTAHVSGIGGHCNPNTCFFDTDSVTSLSSGLKLVKGVYTNRGTGVILADYFVASDDKLQQYKLQINQNVDVGYFVELFDSPLNSSASEELRVKQLPENGFASSADAETWLAQPDVVTAGKVIGSIYVNK